MAQHRGRAGARRRGVEVEAGAQAASSGQGRGATASGRGRGAQRRRRGRAGARRRRGRQGAATASTSRSDSLVASRCSSVSRRSAAERQIEGLNEKFDKCCLYTKSIGPGSWHKPGPMHPLGPGWCHEP